MATSGLGIGRGTGPLLQHRDTTPMAGLTTLNEGQKVEYELVPGKDGKSAADKLVVLD